ncbi:MAG: DUF3324 domain-containing protein [Kurthia sp.]|nr:DUF3324 domain-containing protein [Candidatus Kurthia equi]
MFAIMIGMGLVVSLFIPGKAQIASAAELNFSVESVLPDNQRDKKQTYFDLRMKPGQEQTVYVLLKNSTKKKVTVNIGANEAKTNMNGTTQYDTNKIERDSTLKYSLADIVTVEKKVVVKPNSEQKVPVKIKMPNEDIPGIILGGLSFQQKDSEVDKDEKSEEQGLSIKNRFSYNLAMMLSTNDDKVKPELVLNDVKADLYNARTVILANIQNTQPMLMNQLEVKANVTKKGDSEQLFKKNAKEMQMAPNSNFDYTIPLDGKTIDAGDYTLTMEATSMGETWKWKKDFTVTDDQSAKFAEKDVDVTEEESSNWLWWVIGGVVLLAIIAAIIVLLRKKGNKQTRSRR